MRTQRSTVAWFEESSSLLQVPTRRFIPPPSFRGALFSFVVPVRHRFPSSNTTRGGGHARPEDAGFGWAADRQHIRLEPRGRRRAGEAAMARSGMRWGGGGGDGGT